MKRLDVSGDTWLDDLIGLFVLFFVILIGKYFGSTVWAVFTEWAFLTSN